MNRLEHALALARQGLLILPLQPGKKIPYLGESWSSIMTTEENTIREMFAARPDMNYGVCPGKTAVVLDPDVDAVKGKNGLAALAAMEAENFEEPITDETLTVKSPRGGRHLYLRTPFSVSNRRGRLAIGIDVRGFGGYVVGPGSRTVDCPEENTAEGTYEIICDKPLAPAPQWLLDHLTAALDKHKDAQKPPIQGWDTEAAIDTALNVLRQQEHWPVEGENGDNETYELIAVLKDYGISEGKGLELLHEPVYEDGASWNDRCQPPWDSSELEKKFENVYQYGLYPPGSRGGLLAAMPEYAAQAVTEAAAASIAAQVSGLEAITFRSSTFLARDIRREYVVQEWLLAHGVTALLAKRSTGKGLPVDEPVYTPWGAKRIGDLKYGDMVCHPSGGKSTVVGVYPQGTRPCYELTFEDGAIARCDDSHLWRVWISSKKSSTGGRAAVLPMAEVLRMFKTHRLSIPTIEPLARAGVAVSGIDPYLLGILLGDGSFGKAGRCVTYCTADTELASVVLAAGFTEVKNGRNGLRCFNLSRLSKLFSALKQLRLMKKLSYEKFIPKKYMNAPSSVRLALLQGLMDTDGTAGRTHIEFTSASKQLAEDVQFLARSLGARASLNCNEAWLRGERKLDRYRVVIQTGNKFCPFRLSRKVAKVRPYRPETLRRRIMGIRSIGEMESVCIKIDAEDGLFVTRDFVVTHNTITMVDMACRIASDMDWHGTPVKQGFAIIYVCGEDDIGLQQQFSAWCKYHGRVPADDRFIITAGSPNLMNGEDVRVWAEHLTRQLNGQRCVMFVDTWQRATSMGSQNDDKEMQNAFSNGEALAKSLNACAVIAFHPPKNNPDTLMGSSIMENNTVGIWTEKFDDGQVMRVLKVARLKGKGEGNTAKFFFQEIGLGQTDDFGKEHTGLVPTRRGGSEGSTISFSEEHKDARAIYASIIAELLADYKAGLGSGKAKPGAWCMKDTAERIQTFLKSESNSARKWLKHLEDAHDRGWTVDSFRKYLSDMFVTDSAPQRTLTTNQFISTTGKENWKRFDFDEAAKKQFDEEKARPKSGDDALEF